MKHRILLLFIVLSLCFAERAGARHLVGGNIGYEYVGTQPNGNVAYRVYLYVYRDCFGNGASFDDPLYLGVYKNNSRKTLYQEYLVQLKRKRSVKPPNVGVNCPFSPSVCLEEGYYETVISLPPDSLGYHLLYLRCCRNNAVLNLVNNTGQSYYSYLPDTRLQNSSPAFNDIPIPFMCASDLVKVNNSATDVDGDSLVYTFAHPFDGGSPGMPRPRAPQNMPILGLAQYMAGYNVVRPFGAGGISNIDPFTGITDYLSTGVGNFVVAIDVKEYRNGILISTTRRDIQVLVIQCPPNPIPQLDTTSVNSSTYYTVEAGDSLAFPIKILDSDSMLFTLNGNIFNPQSSVPFPRPSLSFSPGIDSVLTYFEWRTACKHAKATAYPFNLRVDDQGCPKKSAYFNFNVLVYPPEYADSIIGPLNFCPGDTVVYRVNQKGKTSFVWKAFNGIIIGPSNLDSITIRWNTIPGAGGRLEVVETSEFGCVNSALVLNTSVLQIPLANAGVARVACSGDTLQLGDKNDPAYKYKWTPANNLSSDTVAKPVFRHIQTRPNDTLFRYIVEVDYNWINCVNYIRKDTVEVLVHPIPVTPPINGPREVCEQNGYLYNVLPRAGSSYDWGVKGGKIEEGQGEFEVRIYWGDAGPGRVIVIETDSNGCSGVPVQLDVEIRPRPVVFSIYGPEILCPKHLENLEYEIYPKRALSGYQWTLKNGVINGRSDSTHVNLNWFDNDSLTISVVETDSLGCISFPFDKNLKIDRSELELLVTGTAADNPDIFHIKWQGVNDSLYDDKHQVWFKPSRIKDSVWTFLEILPNDRLELFSEFPDPNLEEYEFLVLGLNRCGDTILSKPHASVFLEAYMSSGQNQSNLNWNPYRGWQYGVNEYFLFGSDNFSQQEYISTQGRDTNFISYVDFDIYAQCFRVRAMELNGNGEESFSNKLCLEYDPVVMMPNAFTPVNGDDLNPTFGPEGGRIKTFQMRIYNRWGEKIFESNDFKTRWDGRIKGELAPQGMYIYKVIYTNYSDEPKKQNGTISLIR